MHRSILFNYRGRCALPDFILFNRSVRCASHNLFYLIVVSCHVLSSPQHKIKTILRRRRGAAAGGGRTWLLEVVEVHEVLLQLEGCLTEVLRQKCARSRSGLQSSERSPRTSKGKPWRAKAETKTAEYARTHEDTREHPREHNTINNLRATALKHSQQRHCVTASFPRQRQTPSRRNPVSEAAGPIAHCGKLLDDEAAPRAEASEWSSVVLRQ